MVQRKSDRFIVLCVRESRIPGEGTGPETTCEGKHRPHTEAGCGEHSTDQDSTKGETRTQDALQCVSSFDNASIPYGELA